MSGRVWPLVLMAMLALAPVWAQRAGLDPAGLDPANVARASAGDAASEVRVGEAYAAGRGGVTRDLQQAAEWYMRAAEKGDVAGELHLAALYRDGGKGFPRQMDQAAKWYRRAAEQGDASAQGTLGLLYSIGQGVPQDFAEAYYWLDLAAAVAGPMQQQYAQNRQMAGTHITVDELEGIEERVAKWQAAHPRPGKSE